MSTAESSINSIVTRKSTTFYSWLIWSLASGFLFYKYLLQISPSIMVSDLMRKFHLTGAELGHLAAFYFYAYMVMQLPAGLLLDKVKLKLVLPLAILTCALGAFLFAVSPTLLGAQIGRVLIGLGGAFSATGTMKLISIYFPPKRFATVSGLMMTCGMLGAVGAQAPLSFLTERVGWQWALYWCAFTGIALSVLMVLGLQSGKDQTSDKLLTRQTLVSHLKHLLQNKQCWLIGLFSGLAFAPISAFGGLWGVPFISAKFTMTNTHAAMLTSMIFLGFALGCPLSGYLSDLVGKRKPLMCLGTALGCIALILMIYLPFQSIWLLAILMFSFGFFTSFFFISFAMIREINPIIIGGTAIGFINTFDAIFGALSEPSVGALLDWRWSGEMINGIRHFSLAQYQGALSLLPMAMIIALCFSGFVKETQCLQLEKE